MRASEATVAPAGGRGLMFPESWPDGVRAAVFISIATIAVYAGAWRAPSIAGDPVHLADNLATGSPWPVANLSLAWNRAAGGTEVTGYHAVNFLLHAFAGWLLFNVLAQMTDRWKGRGGPGECFLPALFGALLWTVHPLHTETVVHVGHRGELLGGVFLFLTLYAFIQAAGKGAAGGWMWLAVVACALGMAASPAFAAAPLLVLLYDRAFISGTFREAWRRHRWRHAALGATWTVLGLVLWRAARPGESAGFAFGEDFGLHVATQARAVLLYLKLALWPDPLVFDYGAPSGTPTGEAWPFIASALGLILGTGAALVRWPRVGFAGAWFLLPLAAGSALLRSGMEGISEHRTYVPLAALTALLVWPALARNSRRALVGIAALAVVCGVAARQRTTTYLGALGLWSDTVARAPSNGRAHFHLANALVAAGRAGEAVPRYETALQLTPGYAAAHFNLAGALLQLGRDNEAVPHYEAVLRLEPGSAAAHVNLAAALVRAGRMKEAVDHYDTATRLGVVAAEGRRHLGRALAEVGRIDEALAHLEAAAQLDPADAETRIVLGMVLAAADRPAEGLRHFFEAVRLRPADAAAHAALGDALLDAFRPAEALPHFEAALRLQPARAAAVHRSMGHAFALLGRVAESVGHYEAALRLNPDDGEAREKLDQVQAAARRHAEKK